MYFISYFLKNLIKNDLPTYPFRERKDKYFCSVKTNFYLMGLSFIFTPVY